MDRAEAIAAYVGSRPDFVMVDSVGECYLHMGATLCDAILQAGLNYEMVVEPRIRRILAEYPDAKTTTAFADVVDKVGASAVLGFQGGPKPERLRELVALL